MPVRRAPLPWIFPTEIAIAFAGSLSVPKDDLLLARLRALGVPGRKVRWLGVGLGILTPWVAPADGRSFTCQELRHHLRRGPRWDVELAIEMGAWTSG